MQLQPRPMPNDYWAKTNDKIEGSSIPKMNDHAFTINKNITNISLDTEKPSPSEVKLSRRKSIQKLLRLKTKSKIGGSDNNAKITEACSSRNLKFPRRHCLTQRRRSTRHDRERLLYVTQSLPASRLPRMAAKPNWSLLLMLNQ